MDLENKSRRCCAATRALRGNYMSPIPRQSIGVMRNGVGLHHRDQQGVYRRLWSDEHFALGNTPVVQKHQSKAVNSSPRTRDHARYLHPTSKATSKNPQHSPSLTKPEHVFIRTVKRTLESPRPVQITECIKIKTRLE